MCGIVGLVSKKRLSQTIMRHMVQSLHHRGPDDQGIWGEGAVTLGHTRLSIHDLTPSGHQPLLSYSQRYVIVFNGEIYNYMALKRQLEKEGQCTFYGTSDTEVLVNAIECWGLEKTLNACVGMFAFAVWDRTEKVLMLARDRFGEKPLYWGQQQDVFAFASELRAFRALKGIWDFQVDREALSAFLSVGYVPAPRSIFHQINKLKPGHYAIVQGDHVEEICYWSAEQQARAGVQNRTTMPYPEAVDELEEVLQEAVTLQKAADVPVGAFLSGGVDSSLVVAMMQKVSSRSVRTFSIGFENPAYDEAPFAKQVAQHIGTEHTEYYLTTPEACSLIQRLPDIYDEPFGDSSQVPMTLVSQIARANVTVSISGDGGDELFGGYNRYFAAAKIWKYGNPLLCRKLLAQSTALIPASFTINGFRLGRKLHRVASYMERSRTVQEFYQLLMRGPADPRILTGHSPFYPSSVSNADHLFSDQEWMMLTDSLEYLAGDILTKVDRAGMSVSLETRAPFLDHRIFEYAWRLPHSYKVKGSVGKRILKDVLSRYLPRDLIDRPKQGFGIPFGEWLRTDLRSWADTYLSAERLEREKFFNVAEVRRYWEAHCSGQTQWGDVLWNILMFQTWLESWSDMNVS